MNEIAVTLDSWEAVNEYVNQGWSYVDCKITEDMGKVSYHFILKFERV